LSKVHCIFARQSGPTIGPTTQIAEIEIRFTTAELDRLIAEAAAREAAIPIEEQTPELVNLQFEVSYF
jgi:hypothetical protein